MTHPVALRRPALSGTQLKQLACVSMLLDHIGASCLLALMNLGPVSTGLSPAPPPGLYSLYSLLRAVGRLAFPIYCFLLVEGFAHTHSPRRYALRLLAFAVVSEIPFDWAFYGTFFFPYHQNVYWTLFFGLLGMWLLRRFEGQGARNALLRLLGAAGCMAAAWVLNTDYHAVGVLIILTLYLLRSSRGRMCAAGACMTAWEMPAPLAFVPIWFYSGERGRCSPAQKLAYYVFYPAHLLALGCVTNLLICGMA